MAEPCVTFSSYNRSCELANNFIVMTVRDSCSSQLQVRAPNVTCPFNGSFAGYNFLIVYAIIYFWRSLALVPTCLFEHKAMFPCSLIVQITQLLLDMVINTHLCSYRD
ncbi:hypothetical protein BDR04DRAFT_605242 [Suillus decipiens]|nr:hypothetical protein BDR04DRAFT_605242 [Suillus decipiens]